jgi:hypothetical protein
VTCVVDMQTVRRVLCVLRHGGTVDHASSVHRVSASTVFGAPGLWNPVMTLSRCCVHFFMTYIVRCVAAFLWRVLCDARAGFVPRTSTTH